MEMRHDFLIGDGTRGATRTILAVDDSRTHLSAIGRQLSQRGYLTVLCDNGPEALDLIAARGFDLVLLDMVMPQMSGLAVLAEIRGSRETADLPVIILTGRDDPAAAADVLRAGADDHVAKAMGFDLLAARIERVIARARRIAELKRANAALDARIAARAIELGEARHELDELRSDRVRLLASLQSLGQQSLISGTSAA